ncbi:MAG: CcdB family protein [Burkholderiales bacterium]|nr:CcdB family protein [Burkholderiales bacterium]
MARFDVFSHPDAALRRLTPFLLDIQNTHLDGLETRVVIPLRAASSFPMRMRDLNPAFTIAGKPVVADTAALAAFPATELRSAVATLQPQAAEVIAALDTLFGSY